MNVFVLLKIYIPGYNFVLLCIFVEILVDLREAILQVARHFMSVDPKHAKVSLVADYSMESHGHDHENYVNVSRNRKRRAKALLGKFRKVYNIFCVCFVLFVQLFLRG